MDQSRLSIFGHLNPISLGQCLETLEARVVGLAPGTEGSVAPAFVDFAAVAEIILSSGHGEKIKRLGKS
jgi:hypothetical protein